MHSKDVEIVSIIIRVTSMTFHRYDFQKIFYSNVIF